ncbi:DinB family protein [Intrasporangium sp. DVR]|uniref:mycothiol transferase n=1 Tax=Intrasporangium sp. DVR TaxID=3127867 RepID=UPI00333EC5A2
MADTRSTAGIATELLIDGFGRIREGVPAVVDGLSADELLWRPDRDANHIAWLVWHLTRQQDEQLSHLGHVPSVWRSGEWAERFDLPYPVDAHGYGMTSAEVGAFALTDPSLLIGYHDAVNELTLRVVRGLSADDYATVIDRNWDPPVTVSVRLVSVLDDAAKHLGQAQYVRGMVRRRT